MREQVQEKLDGLPTSPGVYLFKDKKGVVVYVGKAKSLRSRVRSYFQEGTSDTRYFIPILHKVLFDIETIVTSTEKEATILENTLIKEHRPKFNVKLRDDKNFLSIRLHKREAWPRLYLVRKTENDGAKYFGPYHSATAARRTLNIINKHFQLRTCSDTEMRARKRPCLQHQIKRCPAPCVFDVDPAFYGEQVDTVLLFLEGRHDELSALLYDRMQQAARDMRFELAAVHRDQLRAIEKIRELQRVVSTDDVDRDVLGYHREGDIVEIAVLHVRAGKLADVGTVTLKDVAILDEEVVSAFVMQRYVDAESHVPTPDEILVPFELEALSGIAEVLSEKAGRKIAVLAPQRGKKTDLLRMASENAKHAFSEKRRAKEDVEERLEQLKEKLRLPQTPIRIECCDISHLGGKDSVGAIVAMTRGEIDKSHYRTFHVRGESGSHVGGDDYGAMYEVLARRFRRARAEQDAEPSEDGAGSGWEAPDLFVVDGGRGQLAVAVAAAHDLGLHELTIVGLAKEKENVMGDTLVDRIYLQGQKNPIPVKSSASLLLLARLRDEAHRFSNKAREKLGMARRFSSALDEIHGIGPATKKALLRALGSVQKIKEADDATLLAIPGVNKRHVAALREALGPALTLPDAATLDAPVASTEEPVAVHGPVSEP